MKIVGILLFVLGIVFGAIDAGFAQDAPPVAEVAVDEGAGVGKAIGANVLIYVLYIGGGVLFLLVSNYVWKLAGKIGIQKSEGLNALLRQIFDKGIDAAEGWGRRNSKSGSEKFDKAVEVITGFLDATSIPEKLRDNLEDRVEGHFAKRKAEGSI